MRRYGRGFRERRTGLGTQEIIVVVVKRGDVQVELGLYQASVADFVAKQMLRGKTPVPDDAEKG